MRGATDFSNTVRALTFPIEFSVALFALLLNFPWEVLQAPLYSGMADQPFSDVIRGCAQATLGDTVIMLLSYWLVSVFAANRQWIFAPSGSQQALFMATGLSVTTVIEWLATHGNWVQSWTYSAAMPIVPIIGVGLSPLLQWIVVPVLVLWLVRRQLRRDGE